VDGETFYYRGFYDSEADTITPPLTEWKTAWIWKAIIMRHVYIRHPTNSRCERTVSPRQKAQLLLGLTKPSSIIKCQPHKECRRFLSVLGSSSYRPGVKRCRSRSLSGPLTRSQTPVCRLALHPLSLRQSD
jgi:hypothetical protein